MKEKTASISLLSILVFHSLASYLCYEFERYQCHFNFSKSVNAVSKDEIQTIHFPDKAKIDWEKENQEFLLNDQIFDVISIQINDSELIIKCISDTKENEIRYSYFNSMQDPDKNNQEKNILIKFQEIVYLIPNVPLFHFNILKRTTILDIPQMSRPRIFIEINSPPPNDYLLSNPNAILLS